MINSSAYDLTFAAIHWDFITKHSGIKKSWEKYCVIAKKLNITLANLLCEECGYCEEFSLHNKWHTKDLLEETSDVWNSCK